MPYFFSFSKNGRKQQKEKKKTWAKPNMSTMNRICAAFDDIGNIDMNWAGIPAFNWQMLLKGPCRDTKPEIVSTFCELDDIKLSLAVADSDLTASEKELFKGVGIVEEHVVYTLTKKFKSLEACYPYIAKYLFSGENVAKATHKQTFWKVFGSIAVRNIRENLKDYSVCAECGAKVPKWSNSHDCPQNTQGFYECIDCGKLCQRNNSKQCRCEECQKEHTANIRMIAKRKYRQERKERDEQFSSFLRSLYKKML